MVRPSPRSEIAKQLRYNGEKLTYQQIGDRMGISRQGAFLLVHPEKDKEYKIRNSSKGKSNLEIGKEV